MTKRIIRLKGGLGNQLFLISQCIILKEVYGANVKIDLSLFRSKNFPVKFTNRELDVFKIYNEEIQEWPPSWLSMIKSFSKHLALASGYRLVTYETEPDKLNYPKAYLDNYFQNSEKILDFKNLIFSKIHLNIECLRTFKSLNYYEKIRGTRESLCIHVRRGDYLQKENSIIFNVLSIEYYQKVYQELSKELEVITTFIFSDDVEFCKKNLDIPNSTYIENCTVIEDLFLMSICKYHIISNSTFSWWGAFLSKTTEKVFVPAQWFRPNRIEKIIFPENWEKR